MTEVELVVAAIHTLGNVRPSADRAWSRPPASKVLDCVLSLRRRYHSFVVPRLDAFEQGHPNTRGIRDLQGLINTHSSSANFSEQVLNYRDPARAETLSGVVGYLVRVLDQDSGCIEEDALASWAKRARPADYKTVGVRGFGLAGYQYLRMLFGANTTKPDVHICRFVRSALNRPVTDVVALEFLERAAPLAGVGLRDLDTTIWETSARRLRQTPTTHDQARSMCEASGKVSSSGVRIAAEMEGHIVSDCDSPNQGR